MKLHKIWFIFPKMLIWWISHGTVQFFCSHFYLTWVRRLIRATVPQNIGNYYDNKLQSYELWWLYCFDNFKVLASMLWILIWWYVAISFNRELSSIQHIVRYLVPYSFRSLSTDDEFRINFDTKRGFQLNFSWVFWWVMRYCSFWPYDLDHIIWTILHGPYYIDHFIWTISYGQYHMVHLIWNFSLGAGKIELETSLMRAGHCS